MNTVNHKLFGQGTVISNDAKTVTVNFNGEQKTLVIKFANLLNEDGSAWKPTKVVAKKSYSFNEICKEDKDFFIRTGVVDLSGNYTENDTVTLIKAHEEKRTGEWA